MIPIVRLDSLRKGLEWFDTPNPIEFRCLFSCGIRTFDVSFELGKCNWMQWTIAWVHELCLSFFLRPYCCGLFPLWGQKVCPKNYF
jgi:hypothetical protein